MTNGYHQVTATYYRATGWNTVANSLMKHIEVGDIPEQEQTKPCRSAFLTASRRSVLRRAGVFCLLGHATLGMASADPGTRTDDHDRTDHDRTDLESWPMAGRTPTNTNATGSDATPQGARRRTRVDETRHRWHPGRASRHRTRRHAPRHVRCAVRSTLNAFAPSSRSASFAANARTRANRIPCVLDGLARTRWVCT